MTMTWQQWLHFTNPLGGLPLAKATGLWGAPTHLNRYYKPLMFEKSHFYVLLPLPWFLFIMKWSCVTVQNKCSLNISWFELLSWIALIEVICTASEITLHLYNVIKGMTNSQYPTKHSPTSRCSDTWTSVKATALQIGNLAEGVLCHTKFITSHK